MACALGTVLLLGTSTPLRAGTLPLWEIAAGGVGLQLPVYRGAEQTQSHVLPFVYPVYRGRTLRVDEEGARGRLFTSARVALDVSLDGNIPADSDDIDAREGMPDLDPSLQFGPSLDISLWRDASSGQLLSLHLPVRGVFTIDAFVMQSIGFTASPHVRYYRNVRVLERPWRLRVSVGLEFGSERFHDYYYQVDPAFASTERPAFDARAGYGGTRSIVTLTSRHPEGRSWISLFARYDNVDNARFEQSPLVGRRDGLTVGVVYAHFLARSKQPAGHRSTFELQATE